MIKATETLNVARNENASPMVSGDAIGYAGFDDLVATMDAIADGMELECIHWIRGEAGPNWCHSCGKAVAKHLRRRATRKEKRDYILDGGFPGGDEDGCARCEGCGKLLHYSLTDHGVENELEHFLKYFDQHGAIEPETAYELARVFEYGKHIAELTDDLSRLASMVRRQIEA